MEPDDFTTEDCEPLDDAAEWEANQVAADLVAETNDDMEETPPGGEIDGGGDFPE